MCFVCPTTSGESKKLKAPVERPRTFWKCRGRISRTPDVPSGLPTDVAVRVTQLRAAVFTQLGIKSKEEMTDYPWAGYSTWRTFGNSGKTSRG